MESPSSVYSKYILLAEDDEDDCFIFKNALEELPLTFHLTIVPNGEELMRLLNDATLRLPDVLFLDLNMPRKNGFECLQEIRSNKALNELPVVIFSSAYAPDIVDKLFKDGAQYYVRKPDDITEYKKVIFQALHLKNKNSIHNLQHKNL